MGSSSVNDDDMGHRDRTTLWFTLLVWLQPHVLLLDRGRASFGLNCGNLSLHKTFVDFSRQDRPFAVIHLSKTLKKYHLLHLPYMYFLANASLLINSPLLINADS